MTCSIQSTRWSASSCLRDYPARRRNLSSLARWVSSGGRASTKAWLPIKWWTITSSQTVLPHPCSCFQARPYSTVSAIQQSQPKSQPPPRIFHRSVIIHPQAFISCGQDSQHQHVPIASQLQTRGSLSYEPHQTQHFRYLKLQQVQVHRHQTHFQP